MKKIKLFSILALLFMAETGAVAQTETLLTTITATGKEQANYSTANVATVSFSYTAGGSSAYLANWGWWGYGWSATVNAAEGYTITKCVFFDDANRTATDSEAPFVVETTEEDKTPRINGTPIDGGIYQSKGIKKIEVYGYENPTTVNVTGVTLSQSEAAMTVGGETLTLTATVAPDNATDKTVVWTSSDPTVATVADGVVTAVAAGTANITVTTTDGNYTATCVVTVTAPEPQPAQQVITWDSNTISSISMRDGGQSFTKDGVTLTLLDGRIAGTRDWRGNSVEASFKFSTSLGNFTRIEITATIRGLEGSGWEQTSPGAVWTGDANEITFGNYFKDVTQIVFTIVESQGGETAVENVQTNHVQTTKFFRDGQLLIEKNGKIYTLQGAEVK